MRRTVKPKNWGAVLNRLYINRLMNEKIHINQVSNQKSHCIWSGKRLKRQHNNIMGCGKVWTAMMVAVVMAVAMTTEAQQVPSCAMQLIPCADYLNATTKPPSSCCDPLKEAVTKELPCLCNLFKEQSLLKSLNINVTQALELPKLCGIPGDLSACNGKPHLSNSLHIFVLLQKSIV